MPEEKGLTMSGIVASDKTYENKCIFNWVVYAIPSYFRVI